MHRSRLKAGYCILTWLHIYAVAYYSNYLFFHLRDACGFTSRQNLLVAALVGAIYIPASWYGGRFAQARGYFAALKLGLGVMTVALCAGTILHGLAAVIVVLSVWTMAVCFTWAPLEALTSESGSRVGVARMVGIYNVVWSSGAAVAYFTGGALQEALGHASLFWLPACVHGFQWLLAHRLEKSAKKSPTPPLPAPVVSGEDSDFARHHVSPALARAFLHMAWVVNPFAYVAMNTLIPLIPELASRFHLTTTLAGFVASVWMFARLAAFVLLWRWTAWHYAFRWLSGMYVVMIASFLVLLSTSSLAALVIAQLIFGFAVGLIYYSSLFYSMDVGSETQGEHGGYHEMLIGIGLFVGPAVGAVTGYLAPATPRAGIWAVCSLLCGGLAVLLWMRRCRR
jgi:MFS family permease